MTIKEPNLWVRPTNTQHKPSIEADSAHFDVAESLAVANFYRGRKTINDLTLAHSRSGRVSVGHGPTVRATCRVSTQEERC